MKIVFAFAFILFVLPLSCLSFSGGVSHYYVATGTSGPIPKGYGACKKYSISPSGTFVIDLESQQYTAVASGKVNLTCADGKLRLVSKKPVSLAIKGPATIESSASHYFRLNVLDNKGETLIIGSSEGIVWTFSEHLKRGPISHFFPSFSDESIPVMGIKSGSGSISARFLGLTVTIPVSVQVGQAVP